METPFSDTTRSGERVGVPPPPLSRFDRAVWTKSEPQRDEEREQYRDLFAEKGRIRACRQLSSSAPSNGH